MKKKLKGVIIGMMFLAGLSLLLYPYISNEWNTYRQSKLITTYQQDLEKLEDVGTTDYKKEYDMAKSYNTELLPTILPDPFAVAAVSEPNEMYMASLNLTGDGIMGIVEIPKIKVKLPIYHTTDDEVLQKAAGHLEGSSLPIGGKGSNAVVSAHRGLPSAALFTDLDRLKVGDHFLFHVLDQTLCYEVDTILVVEPSETDVLDPIDGKDIATLLTCTPYGVNSHRLVVRGHRVPFVPQVIEEEQMNVTFEDKSIHTNYLMWVGIGLGVTALIILGLYLHERKLVKQIKKNKVEQIALEQEIEEQPKE